jgi:magnesium-transporting ATPase (P-type)
VKQNKEQINTSALLASVVGQVGCLVVFIVFIALGAGILIDRFLGTTGLFTILLMVGSVPVALYLTVRMSLTAMSRAQIKMEEQKTAETNSDDLNSMEDNTTT